MRDDKAVEATGGGAGPPHPAEPAGNPRRTARARRPLRSGHGGLRRELRMLLQLERIQIATAEVDKAEQVLEYMLRPGIEF